MKLNKKGYKEEFLKQLSQFDAFSLAHSLMQLFSFIYPNSIDPSKSEAEIKEILSTRITKGNTPYTDLELDASVHAIVDLVRHVLMPLGDFKIVNRISIGEGLKRAKDIEIELDTAMTAPAAPTAPTAPAPLAVTAANAVGTPAAVAAANTAVNSKKPNNSSKGGNRSYRRTIRHHTKKSHKTKHRSTRKRR